MNGDELLIISPLDQDLNLDDDDHILEKIEQMILESVEEGNYHKAIHICKQLIQITKLSGLALAKSLYLIKSNWDKFEMSDNFDDTISSTIGLHKATVQRYCSVWSMYAEQKIPKQYVEQIQQMNIKSQIPIAQALDAGYDIDEDEWKELSDASDFSTVNDKLRQIKGKEPRSQALRLEVDRDGTIYAWKKEERRYAGWLNFNDREHDGIVDQAIERIIKGSGLLEK